MKKTLLLLTLVLLVGSASVLGTMAYTRGFAPEGRGIVQHEYQRDENGQLVPFAQNKPFLPTSCGTQPQLDANGYWTNVDGAIDKIVTVENAGDVPCYFRVLVAFQNTDSIASDHLMINWNEDDYTIEAVNPAINIDGVPYIAYAATCKAPLASSEESTPSLRQFALKPDTPYGRMVGAYRILVVSQAYWPENGEPFEPELLPELIGDESTYKSAFESAMNQ